MYTYDEKRESIIDQAMIVIFMCKRNTKIFENFIDEKDVNLKNQKKQNSLIKPDQNNSQPKFKFQIEIHKSNQACLNSKPIVEALENIKDTINMF